MTGSTIRDTPALLPTSVNIKRPPPVPNGFEDWLGARQTQWQQQVNAEYKKQINALSSNQLWSVKKPKLFSNDYKEQDKEEGSLSIIIIK